MKSKTQTRRKVEKPKVTIAKVGSCQWVAIDGEAVTRVEYFRSDNGITFKYWHTIRRAINRSFRAGQQSVKGKRGKP